MKKIMLIIAIFVLALGALGVGVVYAQAGNPPTTGNRSMMGGGSGYGPAHAYVVEALAVKLDQSVDQINTRLEAGESMYEIVLSEGISSADLSAFMSEIHTTAFAAAVEDGVMTREQADFMLQRMAQNGSGTCTMGSGGYSRGYGMMGGWGRSQNQNP